MARGCKCCNSELRDEIDRQLVNGIAIPEIEKYCFDNGFEITTTSIKRHAHQHVEGYTPFKSSEKREYKIPEIPQDFSDDLLRKLGINDQLDLANLTADQYLQITVKSLRMLTVQSLIASVLRMDRHNNAKGRYPSEEITTVEKLYKLQYLINKERVNIFDPDSVEKTLENADQMQQQIDKAWEN